MRVLSLSFRIGSVLEELGLGHGAPLDGVSTQGRLIMELLLPTTRKVSPRGEGLRAVNQRGTVKNDLLFIFSLGNVRRPILELLVSDRV